MAKTGYIASIAPRHPILYPYARTYMPRGAARDVIKWAWSKFRARILQPPLCQNPAYANGSTCIRGGSRKTIRRGHTSRGVYMYIAYMRGIYIPLRLAGSSTSARRRCIFNYFMRVRKSTYVDSTHYRTLLAPRHCIYRLLLRRLRLIQP